MSDQYVEKSFLYLILVSVLLHVGLFGAVFYLVPKEKPKPVQEPQMLDLNDFTELTPAPQAPKKEIETKRRGMERHRVPKETAPKGESDVARTMPRPRVAPPLEARRPGKGGQAPAGASPFPAQRPGPPPRIAAPDVPKPGGGLPAAPSPDRSAKSGEGPQRGAGLSKPRSGKGEPGDLAKLFPNSRTLARIEDDYRKKYGPEVEEGDSTFLNTDDVLFGSFLHRFENAVYGVWHYPQAALELGQQGVCAVKITFNRKGEIENVQQLDSSGSKILDREVLRTLHMLGPVGGFPKGYDRESFNLIAFFHYRIGGVRTLR